MLRDAIYGRMGVAGLKDINLGSPKLYQTDARFAKLVYGILWALFDHNDNKISQI